MMAAYQQQPMQPGMQHGHPGMAQHMQHMGQPMMQPGVSGPGQPHVSQAGAMMGMQPGANGPMGAMQGGQPGMGIPGQGMGGQSMAGGQQNPQALSHMNPQQAQMMHLQQQMQAQQQGNPQQLAMAQAQHQQRMHMQQRAMAQAAQAQANGMMGMQQGVHGMTQQQMAMLQQGNAGGHPGAVTLPPHLQQQMQLQALRAQQNHHAQLQQQQMAMQHANSQQSNPGQSGPPNQQGQPGHPSQMRPQSRMANPNQQNQPPQPQHPQQDQQGQSQQGTPQQGQQPSQQQGQQPGMNPQQMQAQAMNQRRMALMQQQQQQQMQAQRMQAAQLQAQQQPQQQQTRPGTFILRINLLCDDISNFDSSNGKDIGLWNDFVDKHFAQDGRLLHSFNFNDNPNSKTRKFEVLRPTIARYFYTYFESGAQTLRLHVEHARETPMANGRYQVSCSNATLSVSYASGARLEMTGSLNALFAPSLDSLIECLEIQQTGVEETISRSGIERVLSSWSPTMETKSPKMAKNKLPKAQQKLQQQMNGLTIDSFPKAPKGDMGVTSRVQQFLELGETMNIMSELMHFSQDQKLRPEQALEAWLAQNESGGQQQQGGAPQIHLPPNGVQQMGNRTPSMQHMQMPGGPGGPQGNFSSPSVSNLNLPMQNGMNGSPHIANNPGLAPNNMNMGSHTPSPHISNMAAPPMVPQHSQQGTNSSAASANTSPQVNSKRRRSQVKLEDDSTGPEGGMAPSQRSKPSPRVGKKAKPGGQPG